MIVFNIIKQNIILAEVFVLITGGGGGGKRPVATSYIYKIFKQNKQLEWFIFTQNLLLH